MSNAPEFSVPNYPHKKQGLIREEMEGADEVIFVDDVSGSNFAMNRMAAIILELCDGEHTPAAIAGIIAESLAADPEQVTADTEAILTEFSAYGLIDGDD